MKIVRKKVSLQVFDRIKEMIQEQDLKPGDKLPTEKELTELFGVSRTPVREALSILEASGITVPKQGGGSVIQPVSLTNMLEQIQLEFVDEEEVLNLLETRIILESEAARLAASRRTEEDLVLLETALDRLKQSQTDTQIGHKEDIAYHTAIVQATHNPILIRTVDSINHLYEKAIFYSLLQYMKLAENRAQILAEHEKVLDAIKKRDEEQAKETMYHHLLNSMKKFKRSMEK
ncbi:FadR/GntR family transcriptional regulator [Pontibacillus litoralis]|uniref:GntR family transcriptional regulator n=1 Tax=Pontibacillus litoralis JSM 072002 TaxID=1385512 RepID=A0A0A5G7B9_9BACI|nr:FadR/GntR family transcriptional regulator [Pontibacillus litoralis]KGX87058.1 GntR family transcriptional regulator [Pontibacillus litoralis JSM 072002]